MTINTVKNIFGTFLLLLAILISGCGVNKSVSQKTVSTVDQKTKSQFDNFFFDAMKQKIIGDYNKSLELFQKAYEIKNDGIVSYQIANIYVQTSQYSEALPWAKSSVENNSDYKKWIFGQYAQILNKLGNYEESAKTFELMINKEPNDHLLYLQAAQQWLNIGMVEEALGNIKKSHKQFGVLEETARLEEDIYLKTDKPQQAINAIEKLYLSDTNNIRYIALMAESYWKNQNLDYSKKFYQKILMIEPNNGFAHSGLSELYFFQQEFDQGLYHLKNAFKDNRIDLDYKIRKYKDVINNLSDEYNHSEELFDILKQNHPFEIDTKILEAELFYKKGNISKSLDLLIESLELEPSSFLIRQKIASLYDELNQYQELLDFTQESLEYYPSSIYFYSIGAHAANSINNFEKAKELVENGLLFSVSKEDKYQLKLQLAEVYGGLKQKEKSFSVYENIMKDFPDKHLVKNNYAYSLAQWEDNLEYAKKLILDALEFYPKNPTYLDTYGWVLFKMGKPEEALKKINESLEIIPNSNDVLTHKIEILRKLNRINEAQSLENQLKE